MNTPQCDAIIADLRNDYGDFFVENHPGCNENDVERSFLSLIGTAFVDYGIFSREVFEAQYRAKIEEIM